MNDIAPEYLPNLIEKVEVKDKFLYVTDKTDTTWEIPFSLLPVEPEEYFELDPDGSFIYYPCKDIHIDMEYLRAKVDNELASRLQKENEIHERKYLEAIFLVASKYKVELPPLPTDIRLDTLRSLAVLHGLSTNDYLNELAEHYRR
jgi:hypothetical protein